MEFWGGDDLGLAFERTVDFFSIFEHGMSKLKLDEKDLFKSEGSFCIGTTLLKYEALLLLRHAFWGMAREQN